MPKIHLWLDDDFGGLIIPEDVETTIYNNAGGTVTFFFETDEESLLFSLPTPIAKKVRDRLMAKLS
jgi:hypothetical protein